MNLYWPIYKSLESELIKLSYSIHFDDNHLDTYSIVCSNLILRAAAEIESLSKELYLLNGGKPKNNLKYDFDAIKFLNKEWELEYKVVLLTNSNFFFSKLELIPFSKKTESDIHGKLTFLWNNAYQNLKHDRVNKYEFGNIRNLIEIMSALFILNLYKKDEVKFLGEKKSLALFDRRLESDIFSIKIFDPYVNEIHRDGLKNESTYTVKLTDKTIRENKLIEDHVIQQCKEHFKHSIMYIDFMKENKEIEITDELIIKLLEEEKFRELNQFKFHKSSERKIRQNFEAVPNKNCI